MTRKDYVMLAAALKAAQADCVAAGRNTTGNRCAAEHIADALARNNAAFDKARFLVAAGVTS